MSIFLIFTSLLLFSCKREVEYEVVPSPNVIKERAFRFAELYADTTENEYELGGQDAVRSVIKMDCSGLIVMSYKYALVDTPYSLLENDMNVSYMYHNASIPTTTPHRGDLIFMGDENDNGTPSHIAIFDKIENGKVYFIDATQKKEVGLDGITRRSYDVDNKKIKGYGVMKLKL